MGDGARCLAGLVGAMRCLTQLDRIGVAQDIHHDVTGPGMEAVTLFGAVGSDGITVELTPRDVEWWDHQQLGGTAVANRWHWWLPGCRGPREPSRRMVGIAHATSSCSWMTEDIASADGAGQVGAGGWPRRRELEAAMRPGRVVVVQVLGEDRLLVTGQETWMGFTVPVRRGVR
jgi:hypothetical protein